VQLALGKASHCLNYLNKEATYCIQTQACMCLNALNNVFKFKFKIHNAHKCSGIGVRNWSSESKSQVFRGTELVNYAQKTVYVLRITLNLELL
jgi:hypothetical protein